MSTRSRAGSGDRLWAIRCIEGSVRTSRLRPILSDPGSAYSSTARHGISHAIAGGWDTYRSRRWKTNIQTLHGALGKVEQLRGVSYDLKTNGQHEVGVIAEEVGPVVPEVVTWEKKRHISGVVKLQATISANGSVKSIEVVGGNPVLIKAAQDSVRDWKFAAAPGETRELIELHFDTH